MNNTDPMWLYCSKGEHCQSGMAMVVNPPDASRGETLDAYFAAAKGVQMASQPEMVQGGVVRPMSMGGGSMTTEMGGMPTMSGSAAAGGASASGTPGAAASYGAPAGWTMAGALAAVLAYWL